MVGMSCLALRSSALSVCSFWISKHICFVRMQMLYLVLELCSPVESNGPCHSARYLVSAFDPEVSAGARESGQMPTLLPCAAEWQMEGQRFGLSFPLCPGTELANRGLLTPGKVPDLALSGLLGTLCIPAAGECSPLHSELSLPLFPDGTAAAPLTKLCVEAAIPTLCWDAFYPQSSS